MVLQGYDTSPVFTLVTRGSLGETSLVSFPSDLEIAQAATIAPLSHIAEQLGIREEFLEPYGRHVAKIDLSVLQNVSSRPEGKYVVVTAITPTPLGEGKTTTSVGLAQAMRHIGKVGLLALRQPSMGPSGSMVRL